ncbi:hypothetical protein AO501_26665 [Mycobacterium gordonae]|uniref:AAA domain-containing protein n=1 Tax=Mycobacterium gordonae TaxID=1778 RepID=A0A0Q2R9Y5_MYCGO|nr:MULTISPECIES: AAA family ATPase [Mycobacterium]KQH80814.1 hypothetical protein AO501_26665 [Mycobacterium gordonae]
MPTYEPIKLASQVTVAIGNQKGGVGKTLTTINFVRAAATLGLRVLAVDADPQSNMTATLAPSHQGASLERSLATVLDRAKSHSLLDTIVASEWDGVDVVPAGGEDLADAQQNLVIMKAGRESRLRRALADVDGKYDIVFVDCPPSLDQLTINSLTAADALLVVTEPGQYALNGLDRLLDTIEIVREYTNPSLILAGVVINGYKYTRRMDRWCNDIRTAFGELAITVLDPPIHELTWIAEAQEAGLGLDEWPDPKATALHDMYLDKLRTVLDTIAKERTA